MSSEGIQITIPDFDDTEYGSTPFPFGRSQHAFGFGGSGFGSSGFGSSAGSGQDSPTMTTTLASYERSDKTYFQAHNRGDSVASVDSANSLNMRFTSKQSSFAHSSHPSTSSTPFTKKPSFASIRAAFKGGKNNETPPVPQIDHQGYPLLKNPFNRSTSSLNHNVTMSTRGPISGPVTSSPPYVRPQTPSSGESRFARATSFKVKNHGYGKSQSGSIFQISDIGSDSGAGLQFPSSPPPVPRMPVNLGFANRNETSPFSDLEEDKIVMDPKSPSDYALHQVFMRFASIAESKIDAFLQQTTDRDPLLPELMGPGIDEKLDETLRSLGKIAQRHSKAVVDSIMRWRRSQNDPVGSDIINLHIGQLNGSTRPIRPHDVPALLNERKSLASIYIMCRALIAVLQSLPKDGLAEALGYSLEETTFEQFRKPDLKLLAQSANHRANAELYATLLGHLAHVRFLNVTDRFLAELGPIASGLVPKDLDMKYENLVKGLKYIQIKVWPPELFEEGAEFLDSLSKYFANAHGLRLKIAFAGTLLNLLHPIGKTAQAETNNPQWAKAIEVIYPKAKEMMSKPRYWHVAYPLLITSLCVAPQAFFLKNWVACFENGVSKLKEKLYRLPILNGMMRLVWTYLYRCQESASTTASKLDGILKHFFPPNRLNVIPQEEHIQPLVYIVHFILSRHFEYGRDLCLELIQESAIRAANQSGSIGNVLASERTAIAIQAILLSLHCIEREEPFPTWPSATDFTIIPSWDDYPSSSEFVPQSIMTKPGIQEFFDRCGTTLGLIATFCGNTVGRMSVFDEQWLYARLNPTYEESPSFIIRRHPDSTVAYPTSLVPHISLLQTCFQSWPRCLHPSLPLTDAIDLLLHGVIHVEPLLSEIAREAIKRFMNDSTQALVLLSRYTSFLFSPSRLSQEGAGPRLLVEASQLLDLWVNIIDRWVRKLMQPDRTTLSEEEECRCAEIEAGALFLLIHEKYTIHCAGVRVFRVLGLLTDHLAPGGHSDVISTRIVDVLHGREGGKFYLQGYDELLDKSELTRLEQWRQSRRADVPLRMADSSNEKDRKLWHYAFPAILQSCMDQPSQVLTAFRESLVASVSRYLPIISHLAGLSSRIPAGVTIRTAQGFDKDGQKLVKDNKLLIDQWYIWVKVLCSTATLSESSRPALTQLGREHSRAQSETSFERERLSTTRGLFRYLTPFLDSEYVEFRDAAVLCISSFPPSGYPQLLEDLSLLAGRQFYDEPRNKSTTTLVVEQNLNLLGARQLHDDAKPKIGTNVLIDRTRRQEHLHSAVARIYYLTADCLQHTRSTGRQAALANVLKFIRNTQAFLTTPEMRDNHSLQLLRRYFCGTVERLFDGLSALKDSDRFIPSNMHLTLYHMCEEWCQLGPQAESTKQRLILMQRAAASTSPESSDAVQRFQVETTTLSQAAVGALSSLCHKAYFPPEQSSSSPTERLSPENPRPLTASAVLDRFTAILSSPHSLIQARGKKGLKLLLSHQTSDTNLLDEAFKRAVVTSPKTDTSSARFFEVISDIICSIDNHPFTFAQAVCLGLANLCHPSNEARRTAFHMLEAIHQQSSGLLAMSQFEPSVGSQAPPTYLHAHRLVSDFLAGEHPTKAIPVLSQLSSWLPQVSGSNTNISLLLLQSLEFWIPNIELMTADNTQISRDGLSALYQLMALTLRFSQSHTEQMLMLWSRLVDLHEANGHGTIRFLLEQSHKVGSTGFITCSATVVACLCQTPIGKQIFAEVCSLIEPARMLPTIEHKLAFPDATEVELWSDLDALFADQPRISLGAAQFAWLFLADVAFQRQWEFKAELPVLLHAICIHLDHRHSFVREQARRMLFQLLRSWLPGYDELPDRSTHRNRSELKCIVAQLEHDEMFWKDDESTAEIHSKMTRLCTTVLQLLSPLCPRLAETWGSLALTWGTACSIRAIAFRSLQLFRAMMPMVDESDVALLLGRLSNTVSDSDTNIQLFSTDIILTLNALVCSANFDQRFLPQIFWCACACLSTTVEKEFAMGLQLLSSILDIIDLDVVTEHFLSHQPPKWQGPACLQPALLKGLYSSTTCEATLKILGILSKLKDDRLVDSSEGRLRDLYTSLLPWCLNAMSSDKPYDAIKEFAESIGHLAKREGRTSIQRIMNSFSKSHFRTRDDFLRQSVASLREHYGADHWTNVVTLLLGLVLNREQWLRIQSMQVLKALFQHRMARNTAERLESDQLTPLLRLLETDLAPQALEVLEEPMVLSGGPPAKHVLRMSMHADLVSKDTTTVAFGIPQESGWCVAQEESVRETCRHNMMCVFDTFSVPARPSRIDFEPELETSTPVTVIEDDLGGLVQNLHELTTFFQDDDNSSKVHAPLPLPDRRLEARVAAILAKSTAPDTVSDVPPTPFLDVFRVGSLPEPDDSEESSGTDSDEDAFIFDSPSLYRTIANGPRFH